MVRNIKSILIVDDDPSVAFLYDRYLSLEKGFYTEVVSTPGEATYLANRTLYDLVICDAKMPYKHSPLGGIILAEELSIRFGRDGVLLVSQVVDEMAVRSCNSKLPFMKKSKAIQIKDWFSKILPSKIKSLINKQFGFVAMPFGSKELDDLYYKCVIPAVKSAGFHINRVDEEPFTKNILNRLFQSIKESHFVIFLTTKNNPNVFYEAGYAYGLNKEIVMCAPNISSLPFDVRSNNCLSYHNRKKLFKNELSELLKMISLDRAARKELKFHG